MAVGSQFAQYINPLLAALRKLGGSARSTEAKAAVAELLGLSDEVLEDRLESGSSRFDNQVSWARYYLAKAGYIDASRRGVWALTEKGRGVESMTESQIAELVRGVIAEWGRRQESQAEPSERQTNALSPFEAPGDHRAALQSIMQALPPAGSNGSASGCCARRASNRSRSRDDRATAASTASASSRSTPSSASRFCSSASDFRARWGRRSSATSVAR
jgi:hypothetical protein